MCIRDRYMGEIQQFVIDHFKSMDNLLAEVVHIGQGAADKLAVVAAAAKALKKVKEDPDKDKESHPSTNNMMTPSQVDKVNQLDSPGRDTSLPNKVYQFDNKLVVSPFHAEKCHHTQKPVPKRAAAPLAAPHQPISPPANAGSIPRWALRSTSPLTVASPMRDSPLKVDRLTIVGNPKKS
eukprot:TRINITY_DN9578_c0_g1_i3.p1 TRINITY_DN9578_c0_g1~~TRINITY_DN9578_c0_g1_i3.p1  ORF type:complete len:180 (+),score=31.52 TRINITY_DN9578_c0_g1_i3:64-603(+)